MSISLRADVAGNSGAVQLNGADKLILNADGTLSGVATPAQFDSDLSLATTEFVQRALGSIRGEYVITGAVALSGVHVGKVGYISGAGGFTITLPDPTTYSDGASFEFFNAGNGAVTIAASAGKSIGVQSGPVGSSITLPAQSTASFYWNTASWVLRAGSLSLKYDGQFSVQLSSNGFQKLPSGLIMQWGSWTPHATAGNPVAVVFPIVFPSGLRSLVVSPYGNTNTAAQSAWSSDPTLAGFNGRTTGSPANFCTYIAIGN